MYMYICMSIVARLKSSKSIPDWVLRALTVSPLVDILLSVPGCARVIALVVFLVVDVSLSVLDLHGVSLAAFPVVDISV